MDEHSDGSDNQQRARRKRLAEALRANLKRRKTQERARRAALADEPADRRSEGD